jgi:hypothetical protein
MFKAVVAASSVALVASGKSSHSESNKKLSYLTAKRAIAVSAKDMRPSLTARFGAMGQRKPGSGGKIDESFSRQLRATTSGDNFVIAGLYTDSSCSTASEQIGMLLNHCFNEEHQVLKSQQSYMYSLINANVLELEYEGSDCKVHSLILSQQYSINNNNFQQGEPKSVNDIYSDFPLLSGFGKCFEQEGNYLRLDITESYPDMKEYMAKPGYMVGYFVPENQCDFGNDDKGYFGFYTSPLDALGFVFDECITRTGGMEEQFSYMYINDCSERGDIAVKYWMHSTDCSGDFDFWDTAFDTCDDDSSSVEFDDDAGFFDDDLFTVDDGADDRFWTYSNTSELQRCT